MKIAYLDLIDYLSEKPSKDLLSEKLFQLGHEHEIDGDVFDMELTPNRGDCLSLIGLARDLNIFFGMSEGPHIYMDNIEPLSINFENLSPEHCQKISFLEIEIEDQSSEYKPYLHNYFGLLGNKKTNFFTLFLTQQLIKFLLPKTFVLTASNGKNSHDGTCFKAAA